MKPNVLQFTGKVFLVLFISFLIYFIIEGFITAPVEGDSLAYHIPIAHSMLDGTIVSPTFSLGFYPGNAHILLSFFLLTGIPLTLFNPLGLCILFFTTKRFGEVFGLHKDFSVIFAVSVCLLHGIIRWMTAQVIDTWLLIFFLLSVIALKTLTSQNWRILLAGFFLGLLIGIKYSGPIYAFILCVIYSRDLFRNIKGRSMVYFFIPVCVLGLSWYVRNYIITGNPMYPQSFLIFSGIEHWNIFSDQVWRSIIRQPLDYSNAFIAEYMAWSVLVWVVPILWWIKRSTMKGNEQIRTVVVLAFANLIVYLFLPTSTDYNVIVSSFRYSYPAFVPLILCIFIFAQHMKKEEALVLFSLANISMLLTTPYRPKILFILLPLVFVLFYWRKITHREKNIR